ncbi:MAG: hypothetical protein ACRDZQ_17150, partial [Acidimicrobiales bacterium]
MSALDSPELAALAASRPPIASRTTAVVDACERQRLCERILSAPMQASSSAGQSHAHPKGLRVTAGVAAGVVGAGALAAGLVAVSGPGNTPPAGSRPTPPMMSAAYVVSQVVSAMNAPNDSVVETISQNTPTDPAIPALGGQDWRYPMSPKPGQQVQVASTTTSRSGRTLSAFFGTFVQPRKVQDHPAKGSCSGATGAGTDLNYTTRTFYRRSNFCTPPFDNGPSSPILLPSTDTQAFPTSITGELA